MLRAASRFLTQQAKFLCLPPPPFFFASSCQSSGRTLSSWVGNSNLDTFGDVDCGNSTVSPGCESARYSGIVLQVNIQYNNNQEVFNFNTDRVQFRYTVDHVEESEFKGYEILTTGDDRTRTRNNRHGIRMVFRQIGAFCLGCSNGYLAAMWLLPTSCVTHYMSRGTDSVALADNWAGCDSCWPATVVVLLFSHVAMY